MKKFISSLATVALMGAGLIAVGALASPASATNEDAPGHNKVYICHVTPGNSVTLYIPEDQANGHLTGKAAGHDLNGPVEDYPGPCKEDPKPPVVTTEWAYWCDATTPKSASRTVTDGKPGKWEPTDPPEGYKTSPQTCGSTPPPPPPPPADPPAGPPAPPTDFCPDLAGVQWENYDCNTGVVPPVIPTPEATPTVEPTPTPTPEATKPPVVEVPDEPVIPQAVPAGDGSSQESFPWFLVVIAIAAGFGGWALAGLRK